MGSDFGEAMAAGYHGGKRQQAAAVQGGQSQGGRAYYWYLDVFLFNTFLPLAAEGLD